MLVDNTQRDHIAPQRGDFSMFGGLYRPIELIETDGVCIDPLFYASPGVFITTKSLDKSKAEVEVKTLLNSDGKAGDVDVAVEILDMKGRKVAGKTVKAAARGKEESGSSRNTGDSQSRALERCQESLPLPGEDLRQDGGRPDG